MFKRGIYRTLRSYCDAQKRGISTVVASVLIVMITIVGVTLLWIGLGSFLDVDLRTFDARLSIVTSTGYTFYDSDHDLVTVQVESFGEDTPHYLYLILSLDDGNEVYSVHDAPLKNNRVILHLDAQGISPEKVSVAPIFVVDGKAVLGSKIKPINLPVRMEKVTYYSSFGSALSPSGVHVSSGPLLPNKDSSEGSSDLCSLASCEQIYGCFDETMTVEGETFYTICTCEDLQAIDTDDTTLSRDYILKNDIDCSMTNPSDDDFDPNGVWGNGKGFNPLGGTVTTECGNGVLTGCVLFAGEISVETSFTGSLNGNGKTISDLYIHRPEENAALFDIIDPNHNELTDKTIHIYDLTLDSVDIYGNTPGAILSVVWDGTNNVRVVIENVVANGVVDGRGVSDFYAGGLASRMGSPHTVESSRFFGEVYGRMNVGGLVGFASGLEILDSHFIGSVEGQQSNVGGLVGSSGVSDYGSYTRIMDSSSQGTVTGGSFVGGLIGKSSSNYYSSTTIDRSFSSVMINGYDRVGGLVGQYSFGQNGALKDSYFNGSIIQANDNVGGLIGEVLSSYIFIGGDPLTSVYNSYSIGDVTGTSNVGALIGISARQLSHSYFDETKVSCVDGADNVCDDINDFGDTTNGVDLLSEENLRANEWDFNDVWKMGSHGYPQLQWEDL